MLKLTSETKNYSINLPTDIKEFTPEILTSLCSDINIPKYYSIIALCYNIKLMDIAINVTGAKDTVVSIIPLLSKINGDKDFIIDIKVGDKVVIDRSSLERGTHVRIPTMIGKENVTNYIKEDNNLRINLVNGGDGTKQSAIVLPITASKNKKEEIKSNKSIAVFVVEFKIVPISDIRGGIPMTNAIIDPFKISNEDIIN